MPDGLKGGLAGGADENLRPIGGVGFIEHPDRVAVLGELHARPLMTVEIPCSFYHFAFMTGREEAAADRALIVEMAKSRGLPVPDNHAKYHRLPLGRWELRWEQHTEFTTYTWLSFDAIDRPFDKANPLLDGDIQFKQPGPLISAVNLALIESAGLRTNIQDFFPTPSVCVVKAADNRARIATDFMVDATGFTRILIETKGMTPRIAGRLVQRVLEIETYRTLALLGIPMARKAGPKLSQMEEELATITADFAKSDGHGNSQALLKKLETLAAENEAQSAKTSFRFGATRAYYGLVRSRLELIEEQPDGDNISVTAFFNRRLAPAIETCNAVEQRQQRLAGQLGRAADLLRTGIQFDVEQQNRDLLKSMNRRAKLQLRLQETVEGLSVAAISYYVIGLFAYLAKGIGKLVSLPYWLSPSVMTAIAVPVVLGGVFYITRRVKHSFLKSDQKTSDTPKAG